MGNIKLLEKVDNIDLNQFINTSSGERTLGNIMKIKRKQLFLNIAI